MDILWRRTPEPQPYRDLTEDIEERLTADDSVAVVTASLSITYLWSNGEGRWMLRRPVEGGPSLYLDRYVRAMAWARVTTCGGAFAVYRRDDDHWTTRILAVVTATPDDDWFSTTEGQALIADAFADRLPVILDEGHPDEACAARHCFRRYQRDR